MILSFNLIPCSQKLKVPIEYDIIHFKYRVYMGLRLHLSRSIAAYLFPSLRPGLSFGQVLMHNLSPRNAGSIVPFCTGMLIFLISAYTQVHLKRDLQYNLEYFYGFD